MNALPLPANMVMRHGLLYFRARAGGKLRWKKCNFQLSAAFDKQGRVKSVVHDALAAWIAAEREEADDRKLNPEAAAVRDLRVVPWMEYIAMYEQMAGERFIRVGKPAPLTVALSVGRLRTLLGRAGIALGEAMDRATPDRIASWMVLEGKEAKGDEKKLDRIRYRQARTLRMATSLFAQWTREPLRKLGVAIPACVDAWPDVDAAFAPIYQLPPQELREATAAYGALLEMEQPGRWLAFSMMRDHGMRPGDMQRAEWGWFAPDATGQVWLSFVPHKTQRSTRGRTVRQPISSERWRRLRAAWTRAGDGGDYVVPGGEIARTAAREELAADMRRLGWTTYKVTYELRKLFTSEIYSRHGMSIASKYIGDNPTTIQQSYGDADLTAAPAL